jgi:hypothetical protein
MADLVKDIPTSRVSSGMARTERPDTRTGMGKPGWVRSSSRFF